MKIGITIPDYYKRYLEKISKLNNISVTGVCSLIVENFLSYNNNLKKFPLFRRDVRIVFANENLESDSLSPGDSSDSCSSSENGKPVDRGSLMERLNNFDVEINSDDFNDDDLDI